MGGGCEYQFGLPVSLSLPPSPPVCLSVCLCCPQVTRLQKEVQQGEQDIGAAEGQISTLKEAQDKLLEELDATRARLRETSNLLTALQVSETFRTTTQHALTPEKLLSNRK